MTRVPVNDVHSLPEIIHKPISAQHPKYRTFDQIFYFNFRRDYQKISYVRLTHGSLDEKSLS